jgi:hypothetical protein
MMEIDVEFVSAPTLMGNYGFIYIFLPMAVLRMCRFMYNAIGCCCGEVLVWNVEMKPFHLSHPQANRMEDKVKQRCIGGRRFR